MREIFHTNLVLSKDLANKKDPKGRFGHGLRVPLMVLSLITGVGSIVAARYETAFGRYNLGIGPLIGTLLDNHFDVKDSVFDLIQNANRPLEVKQMMIWYANALKDITATGGVGAEVVAVNTGAIPSPYDIEQVVAQGDPTTAGNQAKELEDKYSSRTRIYKRFLQYHILDQMREITQEKAQKETALSSTDLGANQSTYQLITNEILLPTDPAIHPDAIGFIQRCQSSSYRTIIKGKETTIDYTLEQMRDIVLSLRTLSPEQQSFVLRAMANNCPNPTAAEKFKNTLIAYAPILEKARPQSVDKLADLVDDDEYAPLVNSIINKLLTLSDPTLQDKFHISHDFAEQVVNPEKMSSFYLRFSGRTDQSITDLGLAFYILNKITIKGGSMSTEGYVSISGNVQALMESADHVEAQKWQQLGVTPEQLGAILRLGIGIDLNHWVQSPIRALLADNSLRQALPFLALIDLDASQGPVEDLAWTYHNLVLPYIDVTKLTYQQKIDLYHLVYLRIVKQENIDLQSAQDFKDKLGIRATAELPNGVIIAPADPHIAFPSGSTDPERVQVYLPLILSGHDDQFLLVGSEGFFMTDGLKDLPDMEKFRQATSSAHFLWQDNTGLLHFGLGKDVNFVGNNIEQIIENLQQRYQAVVRVLPALTDNEKLRDGTHIIRINETSSVALAVITRRGETKVERMYIVLFPEMSLTQNTVDQVLTYLKLAYGQTIQILLSDADYQTITRYKGKTFSLNPADYDISGNSVTIELSK